MRITVLLTMVFLGTRLLFPQTMNTLFYSGGMDSCLLDDVQKITFSDTGALTAMHTHVTAGGIETVLIDSVRKIFFDPDGTVPVALSAFTATRHGNGVVLSWRTQSEQDNLGWNVLRSTACDGTYEKVNNALIPGSGTTALPHDYTWQDETAGSGACYYKLEQMDAGGGREYSWVVSVKDPVLTGIGRPADLRLPADDRDARVYPNPSDRRVTVELVVKQQGRVTVGVYNATGNQLLKVVKNDVLQPGRYAVEWDGRDGAGRNAVSGTYIFKINNGAAVEITRAALINVTGGTR